MTALAEQVGLKSPSEKLQVIACTIPTDLPESDGTLEWNKTTIVIVRVDAGVGRSGLGYSYADVSTAVFIETHLKDLVIGVDALAVTQHWRNDDPCHFAIWAGLAWRRWRLRLSILTHLWDLKSSPPGSAARQNSRTGSRETPSLSTAAVDSHRTANASTRGSTPTLGGRRHLII